MRIWRPHRTILAESAAAILAFASALIGLAAVTSSARSVLLFFDGNSLALELVHRSLAEGGDQHFTMSAALFFFPEIPVYEAIRFLATTPQQAIIVNALVYLLAVYVLLRVIAALLWHGSRGTVAALVAFAMLCLALVYESSPDRDSLELVSHLLFGGYYNGVTLALFGTIALVVVLVRGARRPWVLAVALSLLAAATTASNPLYILWVSAPLAVVMLALAVKRRLPLPLLVAAVAGPGLGMLIRIPLARFISAPTDRYIHPNLVPDAAEFYLTRLRALASAQHLGELFVVLAMAACAVLGIALIARSRLSAAASVVVVFAAVSMPIAFAINIALGTQTVRYLQPMYFATVLAVVVVIGWAPNSARLRAAAATIAPSRRRALSAVGAVAAAVLALGGVAAAVTLVATPHPRPASIGCLDEWVDGRDLTGAGSFWNVRPAQAYSELSLVQVDDDLLVDPWLVNLARYADLELDYVIYGGTDQPERRAAIESQLGEPVGVIDCGDFRILDFSGTTEIAELSERVRESAGELEKARGFR